MGKEAAQSYRQCDNLYDRQKNAMSIRVKDRRRVMPNHPPTSCVQVLFFPILAQHRNRRRRRRRLAPLGSELSHVHRIPKERRVQGGARGRRDQWASQADHT